MEVSVEQLTSAKSIWRVQFLLPAIVFSFAWVVDNSPLLFIVSVASVALAAFLMASSEVMQLEASSAKELRKQLRELKSAREKLSARIIKGKLFYAVGTVAWFILFFASMCLSLQIAASATEFWVLFLAHVFVLGWLITTALLMPRIIPVGYKAASMLEKRERSKKT